MSLRRVCSAAALVVAMLACSAAPVIGATSADVAAHTVATGRTAAGAFRSDSTVPGTIGTISSERTERTIRLGVVMLGVLTALLWAASAWRSNVVLLPATRGARRTWSPTLGRAPPSCC